MKSDRSFLGKEHGVTVFHKLFAKKDKTDKVTRVAMLSNFFSELPDNFFCTNGMFSELKDDVIASIDIYRTDAKLTIDIFESKPSDDDNREIAVLEFRKYIEACHDRSWRQFISQLITVSLFAIYGILIQYFVYAISPQWPQWVLNCVDISGWVTIWQFVWFWAFEFAGHHREMKRLKQILGLEFTFHHWE